MRASAVSYRLIDSISIPAGIQEKNCSLLCSAFPYGTDGPNLSSQSNDFIPYSVTGWKAAGCIHTIEEYSNSVTSLSIKIIALCVPCSYCRDLIRGEFVGSVIAFCIRQEHLRLSNETCVEIHGGDGGKQRRATTAGVPSPDAPGVRFDAIRITRTLLLAFLPAFVHCIASLRMLLAFPLELQRRRRQQMLLQLFRTRHAALRYCCQYFCCCRIA